MARQRSHSIEFKRQVAQEFIAGETMSAFGRLCSLIPGLGIKLSAIVLAGPTVLSAVGVSPPHDGVR